jgi:hypothetical protein
MRATGNVRLSNTCLRCYIRTTFSALLVLFFSTSSNSCISIPSSKDLDFGDLPLGAIGISVLAADLIHLRNDRIRNDALFEFGDSCEGL